MKALSADDRFNTELVKLLLKLASSDAEVDPREVQLIAGAGRSWGVPEETLQTLLQLLQVQGPFPEPDMVLLKARADEVLTAARALVLTDGKVKREETTFLKTLQQALA